MCEACWRSTTYVERGRAAGDLKLSKAWASMLENFNHAKLFSNVGTTCLPYTFGSALIRSVRAELSVRSRVGATVAEKGKRPVCSFTECQFTCVLWVGHPHQYFLSRFDSYFYLFCACVRACRSRIGAAVMKRMGRGVISMSWTWGWKRARPVPLCCR